MIIQLRMWTSSNSHIQLKVDELVIKILKQIKTAGNLEQNNKDFNL